MNHNSDTHMENSKQIGEMLSHMLEKQERSNSSLDLDWRDRCRDWKTAILVESAELIDHTAWKWWKAGATDTDQAQMEVVDLWHFLLSMMLQEEPMLQYSNDSGISRDRKAEYYASWYTKQYLTACIRSAELPAEEIDVTRLSSAVKQFTHSVMSESNTARNSLPHFLRVMSAAGLSFDWLYRMYIAKNILNNFRWTHGSREGTYVKEWFGREDNEYLTDVLYGASLVGEELEALLQECLEEKYQQVLSKRA